MKELEEEKVPQLAQEKEKEKEKDKEEEKQLLVVEEEKPVEPNQDMLNQLIMMGFALEFAKKALIKVKNESVAAALDAIEDIQTKAKEVIIAKETAVSAKKQKILSWICQLCTYINPEGKATCEMCTYPVPQSSIIEEKNEDDILKEKEDAEAKKRIEEDTKYKEEEMKRTKE